MLTVLNNGVLNKVGVPQPQPENNRWIRMAQCYPARSFMNGIVSNYKQNPSPVDLAVSKKDEIFKILTV